MRWTSTAVVKKKSQWAVQVQSDTGEHRELTYKTKAQAKYFAAVLSLGPAQLPEKASLRIKRHLSALPKPDDALSRAEATLDDAFHAESSLLGSSPRASTYAPPGTVRAEPAPADDFDDLDAQLTRALVG